MRYFMVQIHYDNPQLLSGKVDNTVLKMYYSETLRPTDAGKSLFWENYENFSKE